MSGFDDRGLKQKRIAVTNVLAALAAEGDLPPLLMQTLATVCRRAGIDSAELAEAMTDPPSVQLSPPADDSERLGQLADIVSLAMTGHQLDEPGLSFCLTAAVSLGFSPDESPNLLRLILEQLWLPQEESLPAGKSLRIPVKSTQEF